MTKASGATFAACKRTALKELYSAEIDDLIPDTVRFANDEHGFRITLGIMDGKRETRIVRVITWRDVERATANIVTFNVATMREELARADIQKGDHV